MKKTYLPTVVAALFAAPITTAIAADTLLDDVVVSSSRSEQRSFDAPASVQSVNRDVIQDSGPQVNISEALNKVPGVVALNRQNYAQDLQISIRGFGARSAFGVRGIRILVDDIPATIPDGQGQSSTVSLTSADRIEVLRGPMAQLYGNSAGGVIQAFTKDPTEDLQLTLSGYHGSFGMDRTAWQYSEKVGKFGVVADYGTFRTDGFRNNSQTERNHFNGKLVYDHDEKTKISFIANIFDMPIAQDPLGLTGSQLAANPTQAGTNAIERRVRKIVSQEQAGFVLQHQLDANRLIKTRLYFGNRENLQFQSANTWVGLGRNFGGFGLQYFEKLQILGKQSNYVVGFEYDKSKELRQGGVASSGEKSTTTRNEDNLASNTDFFIQGSILATNNLSLTSGVRATKVELKSVDYYLDDNYDGSGVVSYSSINPVFGGTYHLHDNLNFYANYGRGFETPTLSEVAYDLDANNAPTSTFKTKLNASKSNHYEAGLKWLPSSKSRFDLAAYYIKTKDEIVVAASADGKTAYGNAPGTTRYGVELSATNYLVANYRSKISISKIAAKFSQYFERLDGTNGVNSGNKISGIPSTMIYGELVWSSSGYQKNKHKDLMGAIVGVEYIAAGKMYANDTNTAKVGGYSIYNAKASYRFDMQPFTVTTYLRNDNLTDKKYVGSVIVNQTSSQFYEPAPGRNWMVGLNATARF